MAAGSHGKPGVWQTSLAKPGTDTLERDCADGRLCRLLAGWVAPGFAGGGYLCLGCLDGAVELDDGNHVGDYRCRAGSRTDRSRHGYRCLEEPRR